MGMEMHIKRFNNVMSRKKVNGEELNLYKEMKINFGKVDHNLFNVILSRLDKNTFSEEDFEVMRNSYPKEVSHSIKLKTEKEPYGMKLVKEFIASTEHPESVNEMKRFAKEKALKYTQFRILMNKYSNIKLETIRNYATEEQLEEVKKLLEEGLTILQIHELTGVCTNSIQKIGIKFGVGRRKKRKSKVTEQEQVPVTVTEEVTEFESDPVMEVPEVAESQSEIETKPEEVNEPEKVPETLEVVVESVSFDSYVSGDEAKDRLNKYFKEVIPTKVYSSDEEFGLYLKYVSDKYKTSKRATEKFLKKLLKKSNLLNYGYQNLDKIIEDTKSNILKILGETKGDVSQLNLDTLSELQGKLKGFIELRQLLK
jgi:hypothetical protein